MGLLSKRIDKQIAAYQRELIETHYAEVDNMYHQIRGWRHDYRNHIQTMKAYAARGDWEAITRYLDELDTDLATVDTVVKTGNPMTDAILNSKISLAKSKGIPVIADAHIPVKLKLSEIDLCCILGNLFDNAIEASQRLPEADRLIRVYMDMKGTQLYISFTNFTAGKKLPKERHFQVHQGSRPRLRPGADRCHRGAAGRLPQPELRGRRLHHGNSAAAERMSNSSPKRNDSSPDYAGDEFL